MNEQSVGRRRLLAATFGAAAVLPLAAACAADPEPGAEFRSPHVSDSPAARNVRDFGAVGDGKADDTAAVAAAAAARDRPVVLYFPAGTYRVRSWPDMPDFATVLGDGGDSSVVFCEDDVTLIRLEKRSRVRFSRIGFYLTGPRATVCAQKRPATPPRFCAHSKKDHRTNNSRCLSEARVF